ncbi:MAG: type II toxin-antitoxin system Phd/YefM family antitoxin [Candidatus Atribacteria bacterium]|nr:type II toxin-antitoxin system Phd/YefM family antitoxin [Candidatus Atribacteria bacterium]
MINIPIAQAHNRLSSLLKKVQKSPILITRRGKPVGVILSLEEYERLRQFEAYNSVLKLSQTLRESGVSAAELYQASRRELEGGA